jgi:3-methyladenine DNA glycosylase AlkD
MKIYEEIEKRLIDISEESQKKLNVKLCPDTNKEILGIRIPKLRKLAKDIVKEEKWEQFIKESQDRYFEEVLLQGLSIAYSKNSLQEKYIYMKEFIPKMDSWAMTDTFTPTLKVKDKDLENYWNFIIPFTKSDKEFEVRFAIISMLDYYIREEYVNEVIKILDNIKHEGYYVKMAIAWTLAEIGIKFNDILMTYLESDNNLDKFTFNKTLQKMIESYRISDNQKSVLRKMKIK